MKQILIVEDDAELREGLADVFANYGYITNQASNGAVAIELATASKYDLIITDFAMPIMNGYIMIKELKKLGMELLFWCLQHVAHTQEVIS